MLGQRTRSFGPSARKWAYRLAWFYGLTKLADTIFEISSVAGPSMSPTLSPDYRTTGQRDFVFVFKTGARETLKRGDVVVYWKPFDPETLGVKRVVALEGDTVWRDLRTVGMEAEKRDQGVLTEAAKKGLNDLGPVVRVPWGHVWVEGDNWRESLDSNDFGPISKKLVVGKATRIVWPLERWGRLQPVKEGHVDYPSTKVQQGNAELPDEWLEY